MRSAGKQLLPKEGFHKIQLSAKVFQGVRFQSDGKNLEKMVQKVFQCLIGSNLRL